MRKAKMAAKLRKPAKKFTTAEKLAKRRFGRKQGPSAQRRKERRAPLQPGYLVTPFAAALADALAGAESA